METTIKTEKKEIIETKVKLPFYTKVLLNENESIIYSMSKIFNEKKCVHVNSDSISTAHAGMAFNFPEWKEATAEEFNLFYKETCNKLNELALNNIA